MIISCFDRFSLKIKFKEFMYVFLIIIMLFIITLNLFNIKNRYESTMKFNLLSNNILELNKVNLVDLKRISNCKKVIIDNKYFNFNLVDIIEYKTNYLVKIKVLNLDKVNSYQVTFLEKEENLLKFIIRNMKGE